MKRTKLFSAVAVLLLVVSIQVPTMSVRGQEELPLELTGMLHGAEYKILVPENWNGTLLVYARGYSYELPSPADVAPWWDAYESTLYQEGYAQAGSAFRSGGYAVEEGVDDTRRLVQFFRKRVGKPDRVILYGVSMGGLIAAASMEKYAGVYDGAVPICGVVAGSTKHWEARTAVGLAYDVTLKWPEAWGTVEEVREGLRYYNPEGSVLVFGQLVSGSYNAEFEFIRRVNRLTREDFYPTGYWMSFVHLMDGPTETRAELEQRARGSIFHNVGHVYTLSQGDIDAIVAAGADVQPDQVTAETVQGWLDDMNARTNMRADPKARSYLRRYADPKGNIKGPVLTMHTMYDIIVPVAQESVYRDTVEKAGRGELLVQVYTDGTGHCLQISPEQYLQAFAAMESWIETGERPGDGFFTDPGFDHDFVPPPWPYAQ